MTEPAATTEPNPPRGERTNHARRFRATGTWRVLVALLAILPWDPAPPRVHAHRMPAAITRRPNILILVGDDHGGLTLGIAGDPHNPTPRLDRLARQGVWFSRAYCNSPLCTSSRQSFICGQMPQAVGVTQLLTKLPSDMTTMGDWLSDLGYETAAYGKMHFNDPTDNHHGFIERLDGADWVAHVKRTQPSVGDPRPKFQPFKVPTREWLNADCRPVNVPTSAMEATYLADRAAEFFARPRSDSKPFLLVVGFNEPHCPFKFPNDAARKFLPEDFPVPPLSEIERKRRPAVFGGMTPRDIQGIQAAHYSSIAFLDSQIGRIIDALDASGHAEDTIVVYLGDNGYMLGQHGRFEKHCFYEPSVRVPLIMRWPGHGFENREVRSQVELVDLLPTVLDLCGLPQPPMLHGMSVAPLLKGDSKAAGHEMVVSVYTENEEAMVRNERYKLIVGSGRRLRNDGYKNRLPLPGPYEILFDTVADPDEYNDLSASPELQEIKAALRHELHRRLVSTRGQRGPVPANLPEIEAIHWCLVPRDR